MGATAAWHTRILEMCEERKHERSERSLETSRKRSLIEKECGNPIALSSQNWGFLRMLDVYPPKSSLISFVI